MAKVLTPASAQGRSKSCPTLTSRKRYALTWSSKTKLEGSTGADTLHALELFASVLLPVPIVALGDNRAISVAMRDRTKGDHGHVAMPLRARTEVAAMRRAIDYNGQCSRLWNRNVRICCVVRAARTIERCDCTKCATEWNKRLRERIPPCATSFKNKRSRGLNGE